MRFALLFSSAGEPGLKSLCASIDLLKTLSHLSVIIFGVLTEEEMRMRLAVGRGVFWVLGLVLMADLAMAGPGTDDYPFRNTSLSDSARIQDLLGRLTLDEKVQLMSDHPKISAAGDCVFGPGGRTAWAGAGRAGRMGWTGKAASADDDVSAGEGAGRDVGSGVVEEDWRRSKDTRRGTTTRILSSIAAAWWCGRRMRI